MANNARNGSTGEEMKEYDSVISPKEAIEEIAIQVEKENISEVETESKKIKQKSILEPKEVSDLEVKKEYHESVFESSSKTKEKFVDKNENFSSATIESISKTGSKTKEKSVDANENLSNVTIDSVSEAEDESIKENDEKTKHGDIKDKDRKSELTKSIKSNDGPKDDDSKSMNKHSIGDKISDKDREQKKNFQVTKANTII